MATSYANSITDAQPHFVSAHEHAAAVEQALSGEELRRATHAEVCMRRAIVNAGIGRT